MLLNDEEKEVISSVYCEETGGNNAENHGHYIGLGNGAKAQLKKVVEEGDIEEVVHGYSVSFFIFEDEYQAILKEIDDGAI